MCRKYKSMCIRFNPTGSIKTNKLVWIIFIPANWHKHRGRSRIWEFCNATLHKAFWLKLLLRILYMYHKLSRTLLITFYNDSFIPKSHTISQCSGKCSRDSSEMLSLIPQGIIHFLNFTGMSLSICSWDLYSWYFSTRVPSKEDYNKLFQTCLQ